MANLKDVAKLAGVSTATVSRVINGSEKVNNDTKKKVLKAVKALDFKPSRVAQRLRFKDGKRKLIGLIVPDIQNPFYVDVVKGVEDISYKHDYAILMCNFAQEEAKENLYIDLMRAESVDGLIVAPVHEKDPKVIGLIRSGLPTVCVDRGVEDEHVDIVVVDNIQGAFNAVELLISKGHKRIAYIAGLPNIPTTTLRLKGYTAALKKYKIKVDEQLIRFGNSKHESGKRLAAELLEMKNPPTALFTGNNLITLGALETIHTKGLKIPEEVAIIGFDDMPWSISLNPPLTAVSQPGYDIGRSAAEMLFQRIADPTRGNIKLELKTKLVIRNSC
ncbi:MAG: LacI family transcriptional regulator [Ignavibacteria bacterium RBG_13_36_8]|nr:MAG: LacI family transcriptional regulator [Ignavibacteria bacterium RBG_13_36_8]